MRFVAHVYVGVCIVEQGVSCENYRLRCVCVGGGVWSLMYLGMWDLWALGYGLCDLWWGAVYVIWGVWSMECVWGGVGKYVVSGLEIYVVYSVCGLCFGDCDGVMYLRPELGTCGL